MERYLASANKALEWVKSKIDERGTFGKEGSDLAAYYKAPTLFLLHGRLSLAHRLLDTIAKKFLRQDGDFRTSDDVKSKDHALAEFYPYTNGWIVMAAQRLGRFEIAYPGFGYIRSFYSKDYHCFRTNLHDRTSLAKCDILSAAHLGLTSLYCGEVPFARESGNYLIDVFQQQSKLREAFYLKTLSDHRIATSFQESQAPFYMIDPRKDNQLHFMIGYPIAFLTKLFAATGGKQFLDAAKHYLDFAMSCKGNVSSFHFSHKLAWGAAVLSSVTGDEKGMAFALEIANNLIRQQGPEGCWLKGELLHTQLDQTSEIAIWLTELASILETSNSFRLALLH